MTRSRPYRTPEPLSGEFDRDLRALDDALGDALRQDYLGRVPEDLSDRVFRASAPGLAHAVIGRIRQANRVWGRLAVAAGLALAAVVGGSLLTGRSGPPGSPGGTNAPNVRPASYSLDWLAYGPADAMANEFEHLLDARDIDSLREVTGEIRAALELAP